MAEIVLREARYADLPAIAHVMAQAFWQDNLFGEHIHPHREQYPDDVDLYWLRRARVSYWDYRAQWLVAVSKSEDGGEVIAGAAQWSRLGDGGRKLECWALDPRMFFFFDMFPHQQKSDCREKQAYKEKPGNLLAPLSATAMKLHARLWPNRACDPAREDIIERAYPHFKGTWAGARAESWYLEALTVHPDFQGKHVGQQLVRWGLDKAEAEGVVASVISSWKMDGFYTRCGFDEQFGNATHGEGNPLAGIEGANMHWRWPTTTTTTTTRRQ